jgi:hypothetical protein
MHEAQSQYTTDGPNTTTVHGRDPHPSRRWPRPERGGEGLTSPETGGEREKVGVENGGERQAVKPGYKTDPLKYGAGSSNLAYPNLTLTLIH